MHQMDMNFRKVQMGKSEMAPHQWWDGRTPHLTPHGHSPVSRGMNQGPVPGALEVCGHENAVGEGKTLMSVKLGSPVEKLRLVLMAGRKRGEESP